MFAYVDTVGKKQKTLAIISRIIRLIIFIITSLPSDNYYYYYTRVRVLKYIMLYNIL